jgi:cytochrome c-type biogenesis protein CcmF
VIDDSNSRLRAALFGLVGCLWIAVTVLAVAFVRSELSWRYVAEHSRRDAPWYYRIAGVWGGSEGSLLLFVAVVGAVALLAAWPATRSTLWLAVGTVVAFSAVVAFVAWPFDRLSVPAARGFGLNPILEHPAMAAHPPLLYAGLASTFGAALVATDGRSPRRWLQVAASLLVGAMLLGGVWSYLEQGWGGYWAWDPVENTSLLTWMACMVAVHVRPTWSSRWGQRLLFVPWTTTVFGAAFVRSGRTPSVHGFARETAVGVAVLIVAVVTAGVLWWWPRRAFASTGELATAHAVLVGAAFALVLAGTAYPLLADLVGGDAVAVRGEFFSRTVGPVALVGIPFVARRLGDRRGRLAHVGFLVLLTGVAASSFDRSETVALADGDRLEVAGMAVRSGPVEVVPGPRVDTDAVSVTLQVDQYEMRPLLVAYPERGATLAETAMVTRPWADIQATLLDATDQQALVVLRRRPLTWALWIGSLIVSVGSLPAIRRGRGPLQPPDQ